MWLYDVDKMMVLASLTLLKTNSLDDSVKSVAELRQPKVTTFVSSR
jgi:hypothetical protein